MNTSFERLIVLQIGRKQALLYLLSRTSTNGDGISKADHMATADVPLRRSCKNNSHHSPQTFKV